MNDQELFDSFPEVARLDEESFSWQNGLVNLSGAFARSLKVYDLRWLFHDDQPWPTDVLKTGFVVHHDGIAYTGTTVEDALARVASIWTYHRAQVPTWNGVGYHAMCDPQGRLYLTGSLDTHRAHTAQKDPQGGGWTLNYSKVGFCFMGDFTAPNGSRPTDAAIESFKGFTQLVTDALNRNMDLSPHKKWEQKPCPGDWARVNSWEGQPLIPHAPAPPVVPTFMQGMAEGRKQQRLDDAGALEALAASWRNG